VLGLEEKYLFHRFGFEELTDQQLEAKAQVGREGGRVGRVVTRIAGKQEAGRSSPPPLPSSLPQVLLLGQYSTGKTTMIRYLLGREYLGLHVGPEPTTDRYLDRCLPSRFSPSHPTHGHIVTRPSKDIHSPSLPLSLSASLLSLLP